MILYLGNYLSIHGNTPSSIETLGILLGQRYSVKRVSSKKNQLLRLLDMMYAIVHYSRTISVVIIDTYSSLAFYYALGAAYLCFFLNIPYICILRGGNLKARLQKSPVFSRFVFGRAKWLIAPSDFLFSVFRTFNYTNIHHIPNSIEIGSYAMREREKVSARLLWVRAFHKVYNPLMALEVFQKVKHLFPSAEMCMVGPDKDGSIDHCKTVVKKYGLEGSVKFTGVLSKADWCQLASDYDIFINTTTADNTPVTVIEAMALGLPVVSTNVGGVPYLISTNVNGLLVDSGDSDAMANQIAWLIRNPSRASELAIRARQHVESFAWDSVKLKWFALLDEIETPRRE
jgi:L-malate glycosyltransferase